MKVITLYKVRGLWVSSCQCEVCGSEILVLQGQRVATCPSCGFSEQVIVGDFIKNSEEEEL